MLTFFQQLFHFPRLMMKNIFGEKCFPKQMLTNIYGLLIFHDGERANGKYKGLKFIRQNRSRRT